MTSSPSNGGISIQYFGMISIFLESMENTYRNASMTGNEVTTGPWHWKESNIENHGQYLSFLKTISSPRNKLSYFSSLWVKFQTSHFLAQKFNCKYYTCGIWFKVHFHEVFLIAPSLVVVEKLEVSDVCCLVTSLSKLQHEKSLMSLNVNFNIVTRQNLYWLNLTWLYNFFFFIEDNTHYYGHSKSKENCLYLCWVKSAMSCHVTIHFFNFFCLKIINQHCLSWHATLLNTGVGHGTPSYHDQSWYWTFSEIYVISSSLSPCASTIAMVFPHHWIQNIQEF